MAFSAGVRECVASKTTPLVEHGKLRVAARFELRQRHMAARRLIVAAGTKISYVTYRTVRAVQRREFAVDVILPARGVRYGHHHLVAAKTFLLAHGRRR